MRVRARLPVRGSSPLQCECRRKRYPHAVPAHPIAARGAALGVPRLLHRCATGDCICAIPSPRLRPGWNEIEGAPRGEPRVASRQLAGGGSSRAPPPRRWFPESLELGDDARISRLSKVDAPRAAKDSGGSEGRAAHFSPSRSGFRIPSRRALGVHHHLDWPLLVSAPDRRSEPSARSDLERPCFTVSFRRSQATCTSSG